MNNNDNHQLPLKAVALKWDGTTTPRLTAKGEASLAEEIIALAHAHDISIQENAPLVSVLAQLELGDEIPEPLYVAVAEVIAFAYYLSGRMSVLKEVEA